MRHLTSSRRHKVRLAGISCSTANNSKEYTNGTPLEPLRQPRRSQVAEALHRVEHGAHQGPGTADRDPEHGHASRQPDQRLRFCTDIHTKEAAHAGETSIRINLVAAWRETTVFTDAERAALELTEQGTRLADAAGGVTDDIWANAAKYYDDDQLAALVMLIALINASNRMCVIPRLQGGDYQPGQFG
jgi:hypothetical protein